MRILVPDESTEWDSAKMLNIAYLPPAGQQSKEADKGFTANLA